MYLRRFEKAQIQRPLEIDFETSYWEPCSRPYCLAREVTKTVRCISPPVCGCCLLHATIQIIEIKFNYRVIGKK